MSKAKKTTKKTSKKTDKRGAETKLTLETRVKLKEAAALDCTISEMAFYCGVSRQTIYNWFENEPDLFDEIERLREKPVLLARQRVVKGIGESYGNAMDYLSRKRKGEFSTRNELTGEDGGAIQFHSVSDLTDEQLQRLAAGGKTGTSKKGAK